MTATTPQPPPVSDLECKVCEQAGSPHGAAWAGSGFTAPEGGVTAGQAAYEVVYGDVGILGSLWHDLEPFQRERWEAAAQAAMEAGAPKCPNGCGCRLGTEQADYRDCACDGLCCYDEIEVSEVFAERDRLKAVIAAQDARPTPGDSLRDHRALVAIADAISEHDEADVKYPAELLVSIDRIAELALTAPERPAPELAARDDGYLTPIDVLEQELDALRDRIAALAARLTASAAATRPSRKSQIEDETAIALRQLLEDE